MSGYRLLLYYRRALLRSYIICGTALYLVRQRKRCDGTMESDVFCHGCGCKTSQGDRKALGNDASLPMWGTEIFDAKLQELGKEADKQALTLSSRSISATLQLMTLHSVSLFALLLLTVNRSLPR